MLQLMVFNALIENKTHSRPATFISWSETEYEIGVLPELIWDGVIL